MKCASKRTCTTNIKSNMAPSSGHRTTEGKVLGRPSCSSTTRCPLHIYMKGLNSYHCHIPLPYISVYISHHVPPAKVPEDAPVSPDISELETLPAWALAMESGTVGDFNGSNFYEVDPSSMRLYNASDTMNGQQHEYEYIYIDRVCIVYIDSSMFSMSWWCDHPFRPLRASSHRRLQACRGQTQVLQSQLKA